MLRWMRGTSDHPLEDKDDAKLLLGGLAEKGPFRALEELSAFLDSIKTAEGLKPVRAFEIVEMLDRTSRPFLRKLNQEYVTADARLTRFQQHRLWYSAHTFLTQLGEGYRFCLARFEVGAVGAAALKPSLPKIAGRPFPHTCGSVSNDFNASRLSPWINMLSKISPSLRVAAWWENFGSSIRIRGSRRGRISLPIQVSSSLVFPAIRQGSIGL